MNVYEERNRAIKVRDLTLHLVGEGKTAREVERFSQNDWQSEARRASFLYMRRVHAPGPKGETQRQIVAKLRTFERNVQPERRQRAVVVFG